MAFRKDAPRLVTSHPEHARFLVNPEDGERYTASSKVKVAWWCDDGHARVEYEQSIDNRVRSKANGCGLCTGRAVPGQNTISATHPEHAQFLVNPADGDTYVAWSRMEATWWCANGHERHEYRQRVDSKIHWGDNGCRLCNHRPDLASGPISVTHPEHAKFLVNLEDGDKYTSGMNRKVAWWCANGHERHEYNQRVHARVGRGSNGCGLCTGRAVPGQNTISTTHPEQAKFLVDPADGDRHTSGSTTKVVWWCEKGHERHEYRQRIVNRIQLRANGCGLCTGSAAPGKNTLSVTHPEHAQFLVNPADGDKYVAGSAKEVAWWCANGHERHEYQQAILERTSRGHNGCGLCTGSAVPGKNTISVTHPEHVPFLVDPADGDRYTAGSAVKVAWWCANGHERHEYKQRVSERVRRGYNGCRLCNQWRATARSPISVTHPEHAKFLVNPDDGERCTAGSRIKVAWWCANGHERNEYEQRVGSRIRRGCNGCKMCKRTRKRRVP